MLAAPCAGEACHYQAIAAAAAVLAAWGLSVSTYSRLPVILFSVLAVFMLIHLYPRPSKLFYQYWRSGGCRLINVIYISDKCH